jgi:uncharacterized protein YkwD
LGNTRSGRKRSSDIVHFEVVMLTVRNTRLPKRTPVAAALFVLGLAACGGGGGGSGPGPSPIATSTPTPIVVSQSVQGTVTLIPVDGFGPVTMTTTAGTSVTYQSADIASTSPLANATVVIGPVPIIGATPPAALPAGDVSVTTNASGAFSATLSVAPAGPVSALPFVIPTNNFTSFAPPATGYYVEVFGVGADGLSAGVPIPLHRFVSVVNPLALHVSTPSATEANGLALVNSDRFNNAGVGPLTFDESAEEAARIHATDHLGCHYNLQNVGPSSRYINIGGMGLTGENVGQGAPGLSQAFQNIESQTLAEKTLNPPGGHYTNLVDVAHLWAGLGAVPNPSNPIVIDMDYELVTPSAVDSVVGSSGYTNAGCPSQIIINNS